jgi:hypothetical protein
MALQYLQAGHWPALRQQALDKIMGDARLKAEWDREGRKYEAAMSKRNRPSVSCPD